MAIFKSFLCVYQRVVPVGRHRLVSLRIFPWDFRKKTNRPARGVPGPKLPGDFLCLGPLLRVEGITGLGK